MIRWFDTADPGRNHTNVPTSSTRKAPDGQKGIISCLIFNPDFSGAFAAGSYSNSIGIYVENNPDCVLQLKNLDFAVTCMRYAGLRFLQIRIPN
jgi:WD40 repeat protein